jgi:hypothetical protein
VPPATRSVIPGAKPSVRKLPLARVSVVPLTVRLPVNVPLAAVCEAAMSPRSTMFVP